MSNTLPSRARVVEAISDKDITFECEACRKTAGWLLPSKPNLPGSLQVMTMIDIDDSSQGFVFAPLICTNCGHTRLFLLNTLVPELNTQISE